jgi:hypothetical protein
MPEGRWVDELVRSDFLETVEHGVYRVSGSGELPEQPAFAAALRARPDATITGPLAMHLFGVPGFVGRDAFEILTQPGRRLTGVDFPHRRDPDPGRPVTSYGAVRTVGPLDALIDSAALRGGASDRDLRVAWDHLRAKDLVKLHQLRRRIEQLHGIAPGAAILAEVLETAGGDELESEGERRLAPYASCFDPALEAQIWVTPRRRPDFFSRRCRLAVDYLGEADHAHVAARIEDDVRDGELRTHNVRVLYVTKHDLRDPVTLGATMTAALTVRAHELGVAPPVAVRPFPT